MTNIYALTKKTKNFKIETTNFVQWVFCDESFIKRYLLHLVNLECQKKSYKTHTSDLDDIQTENNNFTANCTNNTNDYILFQATLYSNEEYKKATAK